MSNTPYQYYDYDPGAWKSPYKPPGASVYGPGGGSGAAGIYGSGVPGFNPYGGGGSSSYGGVGSRDVDPTITWDKVSAQNIYSRDVEPWEGKDELTQRRAMRAHNDVLAAGKTAGDTYARQTGQGRGTPGGAAQAALMGLKSASDAAGVFDEVVQDEREFRTGIDMSNRDAALMAAQANQDANLRAALANQSTGLQAQVASKSIMSANADRALQAALANQSASLAAAGMKSAEYQALLQYDIGLRGLGLAAYEGDREAAFAYAQLNEQAKQFAASLGLNYEALKLDAYKFDQSNYLNRYMADQADRRYWGEQENLYGQGGSPYDRGVGVGGGYGRPYTGPMGGGNLNRPYNPYRSIYGR